MDASGGCWDSCLNEEDLPEMDGTCDACEPDEPQPAAQSKEGIDLLEHTQEIAEKIKAKWTSPDMITDELEQYVNQQFDELQRLVRLEEWWVLHLVDLKEAFLTAQAAEKISEISVHTERLQEEMDSITQQLGELDRAEEEGVAPMSLAPLLAARPRPPPAALIEHRPLDPEVRFFVILLEYFRAANQRRDPHDPSVDEEREDEHMGHAP